MKEVKLLIGDYEYSQIQEIFKEEPDFKPVTETDQVIIKALSAIISPKNLVEEDVGGPETYSTTTLKVEEPENKDLHSGDVEFKR
jgi:hypothetical protein